MDTGTHYRERLAVPIRWWAQGTMLVASLWLAVIVAVPGPFAWAVTFVAAALMVAFFLTYGGAVLSVKDGWFHAGRAKVEVRFVGEVEALDAERNRLVADPTPYWLVSTRRPERLAEALTRAVEAAG